MNRLFLKKAFLSILIVTILTIGLTGCVDIVIPGNTGTVKLVVSGDWKYDLKMDGVTKFWDKPSGTYTLPNVSIGSHTFEAIDTDGASLGYDSVTKYIDSDTTYVYLDPEESAPTTGTVYLVVSGDWKYDLKMDGVTKFWDKPSGTYTLPNVSIGDHYFEAIDTFGASFGYDSETEYIGSGSNYVYLYP